MRRYVFHRAARVELEEAIAYYDSQREGLGGEFGEEFWRALDRVLRLPEAWQLVSGKYEAVPAKSVPVRHLLTGLPGSRLRAYSRELATEAGILGRTGMNR